MHYFSHHKALEHARKAIYESSFEIIKFPDSRKTSSGENTKKATTLAIAYHNLGVEEDYCEDFESSRKAYLKALEIAEKILGPSDPLTKKFKQAYLDEKEVKEIISIYVFLNLFIEMHKNSSNEQISSEH